MVPHCNIVGRWAFVIFLGFARTCINKYLTDVPTGCMCSLVQSTPPASICHMNISTRLQQHWDDIIAIGSSSDMKSCAAMISTFVH